MYTNLEVGTIYPFNICLIFPGVKLYITLLPILYYIVYQLYASSYIVIDLHFHVSIWQLELEVEVAYSCSRVSDFLDSLANKAICSATILQ